MRPPRSGLWDIRLQLFYTAGLINRLPYSGTTFPDESVNGQRGLFSVVQTRAEDARTNPDQIVLRRGALVASGRAQSERSVKDGNRSHRGHAAEIAVLKMACRDLPLSEPVVQRGIDV